MSQKELNKLYKQAKKSANDYLYNGGSYAKAESDYNAYMNARKERK